MSEGKMLWQELSTLLFPTNLPLPLELITLILSKLPSKDYYRLVTSKIIEKWREYSKKEQPPHKKPKLLPMENNSSTKEGSDTGYETQKSEEDLPQESDDNKPDKDEGKEKANDSASQRTENHSLSENNSNETNFSLIPIEVEEKKATLPQHYKAEEEFYKGQLEYYEHIAAIEDSINAKANSTLHSHENFFEPFEMLPEKSHLPMISTLGLTHLS